MQILREIRSISTAGEHWYRVKGTRGEPDLEIVAVWAVVAIREVADEPGAAEGDLPDVVVGLVSSDLGVSGLDPEELQQGIAGYVRLSPEEYRAAIENPLRLPHENLVWED